MKIAAARDLTARESKTIAESLRIPSCFDKRAGTTLATFRSVSSLSHSDSDGESDTNIKEDLSSDFDQARSKPLVLEEGHPFLAVVDELTETHFEIWKITGPPPTGTRFCACPFRARNPTRYAECLKHPTLRHPRDVKLHIWQKHLLPNYCPVCYAVFETASECHEHILKRICELRPRPNLDGVSEDQKELLERGDRSGASREERWFAIWNIVFPGERP